MGSIMLAKWTKFNIDNNLCSSKSRKSLLNFKDIHYNRYHIETTNEGNDKYLTLQQ